MFPDTYLPLPPPCCNSPYRKGTPVSSAFLYLPLEELQRLLVQPAKRHCCLSFLFLQEAQILLFSYSAPSREDRREVHLSWFEISAFQGSFFLFLLHLIRKYTPCLS